MLHAVPPPSTILIGDEPLAMTAWAMMQFSRSPAPTATAEDHTQLASPCLQIITDEDCAQLDSLEFFKLAGVDKQGRRIVRIVGKLFPAPVINKEKLKAYIRRKLSAWDESSGEPAGSLVVVYLNTGVDSGENNPGLVTLRGLYETVPKQAKQKLEAIYFVHPGLHSRIVLGTLGRLFLSEGFYAKVSYVDRIEFLWDHMNSEQLEIPEFAWEHDDNLECRPLMDYGLESQNSGEMPHIGHAHCVM